MRPHEKVQKILPKVESVEWLYDGLKGKIIKWTLENGGTSHDPSVLAFVVDRDGGVFSMCPGGQASSASGFSKWLTEQIRAYEKKFPRTAVPFDVAQVEMGERAARCEALDEAREAKKPILLYVGRDETKDDKRAAKSQVKKARKFEKSAFGSKKTAEVAKGWVLLRLDLSEPAHASLAQQFGVEAAPALLMFLPGEEQPQNLGLIKSNSLAYHLKKHAPR